MTEPHPNILPRGEDAPEILGYLEQCAEFIEEVIAFGTHVLARQVQYAEGATDEQDGTARSLLVLLVRWQLDVAGGVSSQIRDGWAESIASGLRSLFESLMAYEYLVESDTVRRAYAYLTCGSLRRIRALERYTEGNEAHVQFSRIKEKDKYFRGVKVRQPSSLRDELDALRKGLEAAGYADAHSEFIRIKRQAKRIPDWHSFYGGPRGLQQLAEHLGRGAFYEVYYRKWSEAAHGLDVLSGKLSAIHPGEVGFKQLRLPHSSPQMLHWAVFLLIELYRSAESVPGFGGSAVSEWYRVIYPRFKELREVKITEK